MVNKGENDRCTPHRPPESGKAKKGDLELDGELYPPCTL